MKEANDMKNIVFANCDIKDLEKILVEGLLPASVTGNNNWDDDNRAENANDKVYMFKPKTIINNFIEYGLARLTIESTSELEISEIEEFDHHENLYTEVTADKILAKDIVAVTLPRFLEKRIKKEYPKIALNNKIVYKNCILKGYFKDGNQRNFACDALNYFAGIKLNISEYGYCREFEKGGKHIATINQLVYID